jgi:phage-related tail fiber protein
VVTADSSRIVSMPGYIDLAPTGVNPGTYTKVTVDGFGRVMYGYNPTTLAGYGISDGQPLNANLTSLSNLTGHGIVVRDNTNSMVAKAIGVQGVGLTITNGSGADNGNIVISSNATSENTPATIVARDSSGNFSANVISAELDGNASSASRLANSQNLSVTGDAYSVQPVSFNGMGPVQLEVKLADTGVIPGQYTRVVVGSDGRITLADNPNTVGDLGLIDAATIEYVNSQIDALNQRINDLYTYVLQRLG